MHACLVCSITAWLDVWPTDIWPTDFWPTGHFTDRHFTDMTFGRRDISRHFFFKRTLTGYDSFGVRPTKDCENYHSLIIHWSYTAKKRFFWKVIRSLKQLFWQDQVDGYAQKVDFSNRYQSLVCPCILSSFRTSNRLTNFFFYQRYMHI